jgi:hypothetical protein
MSTEPAYDKIQTHINAFYAELGLTTLCSALDSGAIYSVPDAELENYAKVAAVRWPGPAQ